MTAGNSAISGKLKLKMLSAEACIPEIVDGEGHPLIGSNDSNIILTKLALIMAIVSSRGAWNSNYSMISDAPTSKMALNYSSGFYKALSETFSQSIVITYDFLAEDDRKSLKKLNLGNTYILHPVYPKGDKNDRTDLSIDIKEIKV